MSCRYCRCWFSDIRVKLMMDVLKISKNFIKIDKFLETCDRLESIVDVEGIYLNSISYRAMYYAIKLVWGNALYKNFSSHNVWQTHTYTKLVPHIHWWKSLFSLLSDAPTKSIIYKRDIWMCLKNLKSGTYSSKASNEHL